MQFGLFSLMTLRENSRGVDGVIADTQEMVRLAEDIGFDVAWFAEHHFTNYSVSPSPLLTAASFASRTRHIRLGVAVVVLPLYHPLRLAQEIAFVDRLSGGRLILGVGTGYQPYEFERFGVPIADKNGLFLEYWDVVEQCLTQGRVTFAGRHIRVPETVLSLAPVQRPIPPLFLTSLQPDILRRLGGLDPVLFVPSGWQGPDALATRLGDASVAWTNAGFAGCPSMALQQYVHVTDSRDEARDAAERALYVVRVASALRGATPPLDGARLVPPSFPGEPPLETLMRNLVIGSPEHVAARMVEELTLGQPALYNCVMQFGDMPIARAIRSLERFGAEVLPLVRRALPALFPAATSGTHFTAPLTMPAGA
jgi:alkanesulfonate monooxygenase SsuD/methylene tetrahydromethanopterin reductase-like flavin-dependent oxidoreductase (luciferase family)